MIFSKQIVTIVLLLSIVSMNAQSELGKVTIAELQEKQHPLDTTAVAAILFKEGEETFKIIRLEGFVRYTNVKVKIKIYKKDGYNWANQAVAYYNKYKDSERLTFKNIATYNLVAGKVEKTKISSEGEFSEQLNENWSEKRITFPNVREGSIIEYEYTIASPNFGVFRDWNFQYDIPVNFSKYVTIIPEYFQYSTIKKGATNLKKTNASNLNVDNRDHYTEYITTYSAENIPALYDEFFVNNIDNYRLAVAHELSGVWFPNQNKKLFSEDWKSVVRTIYTGDGFGFELKKTGYFESDLDKVLASTNTAEDKINTILSFVKTKVKWNGNVRYNCKDGVKKAYKDGSGNVAEINLMLTAMLRYAGLDANPILLSTRDNGIANFPNYSAFNYVIAGVQHLDRIVLLDGTEKYSLPNVLPIRDLNWIGRMIRKDGTSLDVELMAEIPSNEIVNMQFSIDDNRSIKGSIRRQCTNHDALSYRNRYLALSHESYLEVLESNNNIAVENYVRKNADDLSQPIIETYQFTDSNRLEVINDKIYISPLLFLALGENPFKQAERTYPIDFQYPKQKRFNIMIDIPVGYKVESLPEATSIATGDGLGSFKYSIAESTNKVQISMTLDFNKSIVSSNYYDVIKYFFQTFVDKQNEKIVFRKI